MALAASDGGYYPTTWYPAALLVLGLLVVTLVFVPREDRLARPVVAATLLFAAYGAWALASIIWADQRGDAWDGANRTLLYAVLFALFALRPLRGRAAMVLLGALGLGIAGIGLVELLRMDAAADPSSYFIATRFAEPVGYINANTAMFTIGIWPCAFLASRRDVNPLLRGVFLAGAAVLAGMALMGQSRGWAFAAPIALVLFVIVTPGRVRLLAALAAVAAATVAVRETVLDVTAYQPRPSLDVLISNAKDDILLAALVLGVAALAVGLVDRLVTIPERVGRVATAVVLAAVTLACAGGLAAWIDREGNPVETVSDAWEEFKSGPSPGPGGTRLTASLGSNRYDFWSVAWKEFRKHPLQGRGIDNFQQDYLARGKSGEFPRYPHSFELAVLSETGLVGGLILGAGLIAALLAVAAALKRRRVGAGVAGAALAVFLYWFVHASGDWLWEFPALGGIAFAMLGLAAGLAPGGRPQPWSKGRVRAVGLAAAVAALVMVLSLTLPWLAEREVERATDVWVRDPVEAFDRLDRAADLNPLSSEPQLVAGSIALRHGAIDGARVRFEKARARDERSSYVALELGLIASSRGERREAVRLLERATRLSPTDPIPRRALRQARRGTRLDPERVNRAILRQSQAIVDNR